MHRAAKAHAQAQSSARAVGLRASSRRLASSTSTSTSASTSTGIKRVPFNNAFPRKQGLYDPALERDSCGVALLASMKGVASHNIVQDALTMLARMHHRGGTGNEPTTGDGAGILVGMPDKFMRAVAANSMSVTLPEKGQFASGIVFMSHDADAQALVRKTTEARAPHLGLKVLGWRDVPANRSGLGKSALASEPHMLNLFVANEAGHDSDKFERQLLLLRKLVTSELASRGLSEFYVCSLSGRTITYKGQLTSAQVPEYYLDLLDSSFESHMSMVHSRFSTNTFPSWDRAQPNRMLCHNGEINTLRGNKNWMRARSGIMSSPFAAQDNWTRAAFGLGEGPAEEYQKHHENDDGTRLLLPLTSDEMTDSGNVDSVLELITRMSERTLPETMMMMIPEAWQNDEFSDAKKKAFYQYNSCVMEPWDGPAMMAFTDGRFMGAVLDRNGLRPSRYYVTRDDHVILSSEVGVLPELPPEEVVRKGRLEPGKMFLVDFERGGIIHDAELKETIASKRPYGEWYDKGVNNLKDWGVPPAASAKRGDSSKSAAAAATTAAMDPVAHLRALHAHGYTVETLDLLMTPMAVTGKEALGSMGVDAPAAVLSDLPKPLPEYFKQLFAQVTNPPIDPIREEIVMSLSCPVGPEGNLLSVGPEHAQRLLVEHPVLTEAEMNAVKASTSKDTAFNGRWYSHTLDATFPRGSGAEGLRDALDALCAEAAAVTRAGTPVLVLTHKGVSQDRVPIPSLMATGAVHHHLIHEKLRTQTAVFLESGDAREVHDFSTLLGFGADGVCPYVAYETVRDLARTGRLASANNGQDVDEATAVKNYRKAAGKGLLKVMSKMGISTLQSYKGAQIFEALGLDEEVMDKCFHGCTSRVSGAGFAALAREAEIFHSRGYPMQPVVETTGPALADNRYSEGTELHPPSATLFNPGDYHYRDRGERHLNDPEGMAELQRAARSGDPNAYKNYSKHVQSIVSRSALRGLMEFNLDGVKPVPLDEVESASEIVKRFCSGAMSLGSISSETHETLAMGMNRLQARSNTGEGGEDPARFSWRGPNGDSKRSAIKQVASGRFGVTSNYLANSDQIQIKMAQGAKPGEGGELPGHKVSEEIAGVRGTTPGVGLISPPPHHDIYSIEDLAQLIHDLKNANPAGSVSVKLVSEVGVGIVAAGCAKAKADHVTVSGGDGGTGAAAWTGVHRAGLPWELGVAEAHQTLMVNDLRSRVVLQADGQLKTGRDVVVAGLLGAEEFGFSTAPLIAMGCIMMRKCHLNTCPVGIATQDPELRAKFTGLPEHVVNFFFMLAEEVRELMAQLGVRKFSDLVGRAELLKLVDEAERNYKAQGLDLDTLLYPGKKLNPDALSTKSMEQDHELEVALDNKFVSLCQDAIENQTPIALEFPVSNLNRTVGTMLSYHVSKRHGERGLDDNTIRIKLIGSAGQSLGFTLAKGITLEVEGDSNDYVGKGLSGGRIVVYPHHAQLASGYVAEDNIIIGNVALYGATSGEAFFRGVAGERFCVRNSGAHTVVEGVGDHGCEYMTGGRVVVLGSTGRNFAAGMSGGIAYVLDKDGNFEDRVNPEMVGIEGVVDEVSFVSRTSRARLLDSRVCSHLGIPLHDAQRNHRRNWTSCTRFLQSTSGTLRRPWRVASCRSGLPAPHRSRRSCRTTISEFCSSASSVRRPLARQRPWRLDRLFVQGTVIVFPSFVGRGHTDVRVPVH